MLETKLQNEYLLRCFSGKRDHFEGKMIDRFDVGDDRFEIDVAETDIVAEQSSCYRQLFSQSESCNC